MTKLEDAIAIFRLALLTEDRTKREQAALKRTAERLTRRWNSNARGGFGRPSLERRRKLGRINLVAELEAETVQPEWWPDEQSADV